MEAIKTIDLNDRVRIDICLDPDPQSPAEWDNLGQIAYLNRSRTVLGTESVSEDRMDEIAAGIRDGSLVGMPVFAYVHSGATIRAAETNPFSCPWDSAQSGFVYTTAERARAEFGSKRLSRQQRAKALQILTGEVETFDAYLRGDCYGFRVLTLDSAEGWAEREEVEACWGFLGDRDGCEAEARAAAEFHLNEEVAA